jgi:dihydrolipoamide dehydrogenase
MVAGDIPRPVPVLVIGGGPGGYTAAARAAELGREVVLVEQRWLGGVCTNVGCIPSKALIQVGHDRDRARRFSLDASAPPVDLPAVMAWTQGVVDRLVGGVRQHLARVEVVEGTARFVDARRVAVEAADHVAHFRFEHAVIGTGSRPATLAALPLDGSRVVDSTGALAFEEVPERLVVVGGGYVGVELGTAWARLGSRVTIVEALDSILAGFDPDLVAVVRERLAHHGVEVLTGAKVEGDDGAAVAVALAEGGTRRLEADRVLVAVGRVPNTDDLQLSDAGLTPGPDGRLEVDAQRRTAVPSIFAVGDVTAGPALAHKAMEEGRVAAEAIAGLPSGFDQLVPLLAFTDPELGAVGLTEAEARADGRPVVTGRARFSANGRAVTLDETAGLVKVVADAETEVVLGVHLAGPSASDLVSEAALAVETAARLEDLARTVHPHPTLAEGLADAARAARRRLERTREERSRP